MGCCSAEIKGRAMIAPSRALWNSLDQGLGPCVDVMREVQKYFRMHMSAQTTSPGGELCNHLICAANDSVRCLMERPGLYISGTLYAKDWSVKWQLIHRILAIHRYISRIHTGCPARNTRMGSTACFMSRSLSVSDLNSTLYLTWLPWPTHPSNKSPSSHRPVTSQNCDSPQSTKSPTPDPSDATAAAPRHMLAAHPQVVGIRRSSAPVFRADVARIPDPKFPLIRRRERDGGRGG